VKKSYFESLSESEKEGLRREACDIALDLARRWCYSDHHGDLKGHLSVVALIWLRDNFNPEYSSLKTSLAHRLDGAIKDYFRKELWHNGYNRYEEDLKKKNNVRQKHFCRTNSPLAQKIRTGVVLDMESGLPNRVPLERHSPDEEVGNSMILGLVQTLLKSLPDRNAQMLHSYYFKGRNMLQIGNEVCVNQSRVYQILSKSYIKMRKTLAEMGITELSQII
jgi:RNA polymerase sigma factor (sigma-70 family)